MSELKEIKARAAERRADKYGGRISLDPAWQDAEAALDRAIAIAEKWFDGLCDANREAERHMTECDKARAELEQVQKAYDIVAYDVVQKLYEDLEKARAEIATFRAAVDATEQRHNDEVASVMVERDEARAAVLALRDASKTMGGDYWSADEEPMEKALADTKSYEQYRKECDD